MNNFPPLIPGVIIHTTDYKSRTYDRFFVGTHAAYGPGYYVFGRNQDYGDSLITVCAQPDVAFRRHSHYNCRVRRGWKTKREAQSIADKLNNPKGETK